MEIQIIVEEEADLVPVLNREDSLNATTVPTLKLKGNYLESFCFSVGTTVDVELDVGVITLTAVD